MIARASPAGKINSNPSAATIPSRSTEIRNVPASDETVRRQNPWGTFAVSPSSS